MRKAVIDGLGLDETLKVSSFLRYLSNTGESEARVTGNNYKSAVLRSLKDRDTERFKDAAEVFHDENYLDNIDWYKDLAKDLRIK